MKYMLDTNIIAYAKNKRPAKVFDRLCKLPHGALCISSITFAELEYGVCNSSRPLQNELALMTFLSGIEIVSFDSNAAREYGAIRFDLKKRCEPIGANDLLIAAHAKSMDVTLVTNNTKEFKKVKGLKLENWAE